MRDAGREVPEVAGDEIVNEAFTVLVHRGNAGTASHDEGPFVGAMPVELAVGVGLETHVYARHGGRGWHVVGVFLPRPSGVARCDSVVA